MGANEQFYRIDGTEQDSLPEVGLQLASHRVTMEDSATGSTLHPAGAADQEAPNPSEGVLEDDDWPRWTPGKLVYGERLTPENDDGISQFLEDTLNGVEPLDSFKDAVPAGQVESSGSTNKTPVLTPDDQILDEEEEDMTGLSGEERRQKTPRGHVDCGVVWTPDHYGSFCGWYHEARSSLGSHRSTAGVHVGVV